MLKRQQKKVLRHGGDLCTSVSCDHNLGIDVIPVHDANDPTRATFFFGKEAKSLGPLSTPVAVIHSDVCPPMRRTHLANEYDNVSGLCLFYVLKGGGS